LARLRLNRAHIIIFSFLATSFVDVNCRPRLAIVVDRAAISPYYIPLLNPKSQNAVLAKNNGQTGARRHLWINHVHNFAIVLRPLVVHNFLCSYLILARPLCLICLKKDKGWREPSLRPYCCIIRHTARGVCFGISWREKACVVML